MLVLSNIHSLLTQVLEVPRLHTAAVFTPAGQLVCYVCDPIRPKDEVLLIVGLGEEVWHGSGVMESEVCRGSSLITRCFLSSPKLGRIVVTPVEDVERQDEDEEPLMLVALNATRDIAWADLQSKVSGLRLCGSAGCMCMYRDRYWRTCCQSRGVNIGSI